MSISKNSLIDFCYLFYFAFIFANLNQLFVITLGFNIHVNRIINYLPLLLCIVGWLLIPNKRYILFNSQVTLLFTFISLYIIIGIFVSILNSNYESLYSFAKGYSRSVLDILLFIPYIIHISRKKDNLTRYLKFFTVLSVLSTSSIILFYLFGFELFLIRENAMDQIIERPSGLFTNANKAAFKAVISVILVSYWFFTVNSFFKRLLLSFLLGFCILCVFTTFSNTGMFCCILVLCIAIYKSSFLNSRILHSLLILVFLIASVLAITKSLNFEFSVHQLDKLDNIVKIINLQTDKIAYSYRDQIAFFTIEKIKENPITGYGLGSHLLVYRIWGTHNTYLSLLLDAGFIPFCLFIMFISSIYIKGLLLVKKNRKFGFLLLSWITLVAFFSLTSHNIIDNGPFYIIFAFFLMLADVLKHPLNLKHEGV